jgi:hypothetical protein
MSPRLSALLAIALLWLLAGCGTGGPSTTSTLGRATFTVIWPSSGRLIPDASNSIVVQITNGAAAVASQTLARPASGGSATATFKTLPVGALTATATAYPTTDGTGVAQATASVPLVIQANQNTAFTMTMASTIQKMSIAPPSASIGVGSVATLTVTATDAAGNVVLTSPSKIQWTSSNVSVATVNAGTVTAVTAGTTNITATDTESNKSAVAAVSVAYIIHGKPYIPGTPTVTLTDTFTTPDGGVTTNSYSSYVLLDVTGVGQSYNTTYNDCFYLYTGSFNPPVNGWDGGFYQLAFSTSTLQVGDLQNIAEKSLVAPLPPYNPIHEYNFILSTGLSSPGQLHFGVADGGFSDNTGAYTINVTQLVPAP